MKNLTDNYNCVYSMAVAGLAQTLAPSQDAHYLPSNGVNFGAATTITVGSSGSIGLVQFDLSQLPAGVTAAQVQRATLTLFADGVNSPGTINIDTVNAGTPWSEANVSGNAPPSAGNAVAAAVPITAANTFLAVDATSAVQGWIADPIPITALCCCPIRAQAFSSTVRRT